MLQNNEIKVTKFESKNLGTCYGNFLKIKTNNDWKAETLPRSSGGVWLSTFTQVLYWSTNLRYIYFPSVFPFSYIYSTTSQGERLYFLFHFICLTALVTKVKTGLLFRHHKKFIFFFRDTCKTAMQTTWCFCRIWCVAVDETTQQYIKERNIKWVKHCANNTYII